MKNKTLPATFAALAAQIIFGFSFMFTKIAIEKGVSPMTVIADRYIVAFLGLSAVLLIGRIKIKLKKNMWKLVLMSVFQPVLYFVFETYGIKLTTSGFSGVMISLIPVVSMISGIFVLKEIPSPMQYVFTALSVGGVVIMTLAEKAEGTVEPLGVVLLLGAVLASVAYNVASRKISAEFNSFERTYAMTVIGLAVFMVIALAENIKNPMAIVSPFADFSYTGAILYLGVLSSVVAFLLLNYANTHLPVAKTTVFSNFTAVVSVVAGIWFMDENFNSIIAVSVAMIIIGVWGVQLLSVKNKNNKGEGK